MRVSIEWIVAIAIAVADCTLLSACAPAPAPVASTMQDPSNPGAHEGVDPVAALSGVPTAAASSLVYACPMHPDVTSSHAGACRQCGMTMVPKK